MDQNYLNYGYTPVYHQLQGTSMQPEPLPQFHHLSSLVPSNQSENIKSENEPQNDQQQQQQQFQHQQHFQHPSFYPPIFNSHQFQPMTMWDNNYSYSPTAVYSPVNYHPQPPPFIHRQPYQNYQIQQQASPQCRSQDEVHYCDTCKRDFTSAAHLKRHMMTKAHVKIAVKSTGCINLSELQERAAGQDSLIVKTGDKSFQVTFTEVQNIPNASSITDLSEAEVVLIDKIDKELQSSMEPITLSNFETQEDQKSEFLLIPSPSPVQNVTSSHATSSSSSENGEFHCNLCNKSFAKRCYFTQHNKTAHAGFKAFKCGKCGKKYDEKEALEQHMAKHDGNKPFKCSQCSKSFIHKTDLKRHEILHTSEKPNVCEQCGKGFIRRDHLLKHINSHKKKQEKMNKLFNMNGK